MEKTIKISVGMLVQYVLRSGDIDHNYVSSSRMQDGIRIHQKLQKKQIKQALLEDYIYDKEVYLTHSYKAEDFLICVEGRADGIIRKKSGVTIEEIKSTMSDVTALKPHENHIHLAQAKCYAYMLCFEEGISDIGVIVTYCHTETEEICGYEFSFSFAELESFYKMLTGEYFKWAKKDYERKQSRNASIKAAPFIFENYRQGQRELAVKIYRSVENKVNLFAQAPTGTGKTVSTLFPCVKAMGEELIHKIFYTTAKTVTRKVAEETVILMRGKGYELTSITLTAKEKICLCEAVICSPLHCKYAKGHFDRVNAAVEDIIANEGVISRENIRLYAEKHCVCPHEYTLDISLWVDVIICDYNHVFDPKVRLKRFFGEESGEDYAFLVDEAHNLVDRSREMFSAELRKRDFLTLKKALKPLDVQLYKLCDKINVFFIELRNTEMENQQIIVKRNEPEMLNIMLQEFVVKADKLLARTQSGEEFEQLLETYFNVLDYLSVSEIFSERYKVFIESFGSDLNIKLLCLDPSRSLRQVHEQARVCVFFSATLTPVSYFREIFGGTADDDVFKLPSPFPEYNLCLVIDSGVSTRYKVRASSYEAIADRLFIMASGKKGNYFSFFPSYAYLKEVLAQFSEKYPQIDVIVQEQKQSEQEKEQFLANFTEDRSETLLAFSVMGGVFSEGIDLVGDKLIGVAVIGVGLPLINPERNVISEYYSDYFGDDTGFDYAYVYPGINKVLQAAGRLIRTETDRGVILLIDDRYATEKYTSLFPREWNNAVYVRNKEKLASVIDEFWS